MRLKDGKANEERKDLDTVACDWGREQGTGEDIGPRLADGQVGMAARPHSTEQHSTA